MNENIDLTKILKDCPKGTKLYSTIFGTVEFDRIKKGDEYPIVFVSIQGDICNTAKDGRYYKFFDGECTLFPSKDQRDWSKFTAPWLEKQGESLRVNDRAWLYLVSDVLTWKCGVGQYLDNPRVQELAKKLCSEYAQKLYNPSVLSNSSNTGKNEQKSTDGVERKFDPKTLQPFDKVLVRPNSSGKWSVDFFSYYASDELDCPCKCVGRFLKKYCIPYNDETKHLVGTTDEAPEYYRYWED